MCGIFGILGMDEAPARVLDGLRGLEYRGYDSCGVAWATGNKLRVVRAVGSTQQLGLPQDAAATVALGHTRWATHGGVTEENAHPHLDCTGTAAVVHNGIIAEHDTIRRKLEAAGHSVRSRTDSEILIHLWEEARGEPAARLASVTKRLTGTYSLAILDVHDGVLIAKHRNPLWVATTKDAALLSSDPIALRTYTKTAIPLEDGDYGHLQPDGSLTLWDHDGRELQRDPHQLDLGDTHAELAGYEHHMLKELHEIPTTLNRLLAPHVHLLPPYVRLGLPDDLLAAPRILLLGAGTSHHAARLGTRWLRQLADAPAEAHSTPEFKDAIETPPRDSLVIALSQSGETLDTLQALERLASDPVTMLAVTNYPSSTIARRADHHLAMQAGIEVGVAATKTYAAQALLLYLVALEAGRARQTLSPAYAEWAARELKRLPRAIDRLLDRTPRIADLARRIARHENLFLLAKGTLLTAAEEGALKLKEVAYQHAEAFPAGELKHGPFALLTQETAVMFLLTAGAHEDAVRNAIHEVAARGAPVHVILADDVADEPPEATSITRVPAVPPDLEPIVFATALQLLSYWVAKARGLPIDRPRNLAKSVTVE